MSPEGGDLIRRLLLAYNTIDAHLRATFQRDNSVPFSALVRSQPGLRHADRDLLQLVGDIRNLLVHRQKSPDDYPLVPSASVVQGLEALQHRLLRPERAIPTFQRAVEVLAPSDSLARVLRIIDERSYSQFPIYDGPKFRGLLTENGITRWLATHVTRELSLVDLDEVLVKGVLREEEQRKANWAFVGRNESVDAIRQQFSEKEMLEAVLISQNGSQNEKLLGIATRWDMVNQRQD
jgi:predicted transcriptional regulator